MKFKYAYIPGTKHEWRLVTHDEDWDYAVIHHKPVAIISYCPFCGRKLEVAE